MMKKMLHKSHNSGMLGTFYDLNSSCGCGSCTCGGCTSANLGYGNNSASTESGYRSGYSAATS